MQFLIFAAVLQLLCWVTVADSYLWYRGKEWDYGVWSYRNDEGNGPMSWAALDEDCDAENDEATSSKFPSPINFFWIQQQSDIPAGNPFIDMSEYWKNEEVEHVFIQNVDNTIRITFESKTGEHHPWEMITREQFTETGVGDPDKRIKYKFSHMTIHWGYDGRMGSEHVFGKKPHPFEEFSCPLLASFHLQFFPNLAMKDLAEGPGSKSFKPDWDKNMYNLNLKSDICYSSAAFAAPPGLWSAFFIFYCAVLLTHVTSQTANAPLSQGLM